MDLSNASTDDLRQLNDQLWQALSHTVEAPASTSEDRWALLTDAKVVADHLAERQPPNRDQDNVDERAAGVEARALADVYQACPARDATATPPRSAPQTHTQPARDAVTQQSAPER